MADRPGVLHSLLTDNHENAASILPGPALSLLLSLMYQEIRRKNNVNSILQFTLKVLKLRGNHIKQAEFFVEGACDEDDWAPCIAFMMAYDCIFGFGVASRRIPDAKFDDNSKESIGVNVIDILLSHWSEAINVCFVEQIKHYLKLCEQLYRHAKHGNEHDGYAHYNKKRRMNQIGCVELLHSRSTDQFDSFMSLSDDDANDEESSSSSASRYVLVDGNGKSTMIADQIGVASVRDAEISLMKQQLDVENKAPSLDDHPVNYTGEVNSDSRLSALEKDAFNLRSSLLMLPQEAKGRVAEIAHLLKLGGTQNGAGGVEFVGKIIVEGCKPLDGEEEGSTEPRQLAITDSMVSPLSKNFIGTGTSALRTTAFLRSCVLPLCIRLDTKPASRLLVQAIASLIKERPRECVDAILLPALLKKKSVSKALCEFLSRVVKGLSKKCMADFLHGIAVCEMSWNESYFPVVTTCLSKRYPISDDTITTISANICHLATKGDKMLKNMKFSAMFNAFVKNYGPQIQCKSQVPTLTIAAGNLKTFLGKAVMSALKKL